MSKNPPHRSLLKADLMGIHSYLSNTPSRVPSTTRKHTLKTIDTRPGQSTVEAGKRRSKGEGEREQGGGSYPRSTMFSMHCSLLIDK